MEAFPATRIALALALGALAAAASRRLRFLTPGGSLAAGVLAGLLVGFGSWQWLLPMLLFFLTSSFLSRISERLPPGADSLFEKGNERDVLQVLANGGTGGLLVVAAQWGEGDALYAAYLGSLAAATADTWGTELGMLSASRPRLITTLAPVAAGTSGAVSGAGLFGALAGAMTIAASGSGWLGPSSVALVPAVVVAGMAGSLVDSFLGAVAQAQYRCGACGALTERTRHCGRETRRERGTPWLSNDGVNAACNVAGGLLAYVLARLLA